MRYADACAVLGDLVEGAPVPASRDTASAAAPLLALRSASGVVGELADLAWRSSGIPGPGSLAPSHGMGDLLEQALAVDPLWEPNWEIEDSVRLWRRDRLDRLIRCRRGLVRPGAASGDDRWHALRHVPGGPLVAICGRHDPEPIARVDAIASITWHVGSALTELGRDEPEEAERGHKALDEGYLLRAAMIARHGMGGYAWEEVLAAVRAGGISTAVPWAWPLDLRVDVSP